MPVLSGLFALHKRSPHECLRLEATGLSYDLFYLLGMAGADRAEESARATAEPYSQLAPNRITVHTMTTFPSTQLAAMIGRREFEPAGELEMVREPRRFAEMFSPRQHAHLLGNHYGNMVHPCAWLPDQREELASYLDEVPHDADEDALRAHRAKMSSI